MSRMPTLYIRNVPAEVYEALKARAKREGRSVNAEALTVLEQIAEREKAGSEPPITDRIRELVRELDVSGNPPDVVTLLRRARDLAEEEVMRRLVEARP
jgi:plasmid stability protein